YLLVETRQYGDRIWSGTTLWRPFVTGSQRAPAQVVMPEVIPIQGLRLASVPRLMSNVAIGAQTCEEYSFHNGEIIDYPPRAFPRRIEAPDTGEVQHKYFTPHTKQSTVAIYACE